MLICFLEVLPSFYINLLDKTTANMNRKEKTISCIETYYISVMCILDYKQAVNKCRHY